MKAKPTARLEVFTSATPTVGKDDGGRVGIGANPLISARFDENAAAFGCKPRHARAPRAHPALSGLKAGIPAWLIVHHH
jgi:hypothetical protein